VTDLSIIIVNYKTPGLVIDCLRTVYGETSGIRYEVIVADNDSGDDSERLIRGEFPDVKWIQTGYNAGFARANNAAIRQASGEAVLLLNSDTLVEGDAIGCCCLELMASSYVAAGVQLLNPDRTPQISGNFFMKGGLNYLLPLPYLGGWMKSAGHLFGAKAPHVPDAGSVVEVDWINGAFLMVKRAAYELAGLMDEDFFLYAEEAEWCSRLRRIGRLCIYGQFRVVHLQGVSANETFGSEGKGYYNLYDRKGLQIMLSNFVRIRKQFGVGWYLVQLLFYVADIPIFLLGLLVSRIGGRGRARYSFHQFRRYCSNIGLVIARTPTIIRNKPYFYKVL
jgi:GT2 family glycosyltransferase